MTTPIAPSVSGPRHKVAPAIVAPSVSGPRHKVAPAIVAIVLLLATSVVSIRTAPSADALSAFDQELLGYINDHRRSKGLAPFAEYAPFSEAAKSWSTTMRSSSPAPCNGAGSGFRHDRYSRISSNGVPRGTTAAGENIAWTCGPPGTKFATNWRYSGMPAHCTGRLDFTTALLQFCGWINSRDHRELIESRSFRWIGLGSASKSSGGSTSVFSTARFSNAPLTAAGGKVCMGLLVTVDLSKGQQPTDGADVILGTDGDDNIAGLGGPDVICGGEGNDVLSGGPGRDILSGGPGVDLLAGGGSRDTLYGGAGGDVLKGGGGHDVLEGDGGDDSLRGQGGDDRLVGGNGSDFCNGGADRDQANCETTRRVP